MVNEPLLNSNFANPTVDVMKGMQKECPAARVGGMTSISGGGAGGCAIAEMAGPEAAALCDSRAARQRFNERPDARGD